MKRKSLGEAGEKLAAEFLKGRGYRILQANYRCRAGEIDIVAQKGRALVFIEVRTKSAATFGSPEESLNLAKREHMEAAAESYLQTLPQPPRDWQFDLIAVEVDDQLRIKRIEQIENVLEG